MTSCAKLSRTAPKECLHYRSLEALMQMSSMCSQRRFALTCKFVAVRAQFIVGAFCYSWWSLLGDCDVWSLINVFILAPSEWLREWTSLSCYSNFLLSLWLVYSGNYEWGKLGDMALVHTFSPPAFSSLYTNMTDDPLILKATLPLVSLLCQALRHQAISPPKAKEMFWASWALAVAACHTVASLFNTFSDKCSAANSFCCRHV